MKFTIPVAPRTKKNSTIPIRTKTGRFVNLPSKAYMEFEKKVKAYMTNNFGNIEPISEPINLCCKFYMDKNYKSDLVGYLQAIQDALVKCKFIEDDNHLIIQSTNGSEVFLDRENPRIDIEIEFKQKIKD